MAALLGPAGVGISGVAYQLLKLTNKLIPDPERAELREILKEYALLEREILEEKERFPNCDAKRLGKMLKEKGLLDAVLQRKMLYLQTLLPPSDA